MFRRRNNIVKKAGERLAPDSKQLRSVFESFFSDLVDEEKHPQQDLNSNNTFRANKQKYKRNEIYYRDILARSLNGKTEVIVPAGRIDILTNSQIIEVKHVKRWKAALGQIITYGVYYPNHQKRIHLFGVENSTQILLIKEQCQMQNIIATFEE